MEAKGNDMKYKAYLFDFDYTLADSEEAIIFCYQFVLGNHGFLDVTDQAIKLTIGFTLLQSFEILTGIHDLDLLDIFRKEYVQKADEIMVDKTVLYDSAIPLLKRLKEKGCYVAIISTKYRYRIMGTVERYKIVDLVDLIVGGEDVVSAKPDPQGVNMVMKHFAVKPHDVLFIGDSLIDANTAKNAGVDFTAVTTGTTTEQEFQNFPCVKIMGNLLELLQ